MNLLNKLKSIIYFKQIEKLNNDLSEWKSLYEELYNPLKKITDSLLTYNLEIEKLHAKVKNLESENKSLDSYNTTLQNKFDKQEEFISKLKNCSDKLNNLFFEDNERRY